MGPLCGGCGSSNPEPQHLVTSPQVQMTLGATLTDAVKMRVQCFLLFLRGPTDHIDIRILQTMVSGIPLVFGLGATMQDPLSTWSSGPLSFS